MKKLSYIILIISLPIFVSRANAQMKVRSYDSKKSGTSLPASRVSSSDQLKLKPIKKTDLATVAFKPDTIKRDTMRTRRSGKNLVLDAVTVERMRKAMKKNKDQQ